MWELAHKECWTLKYWCFWTVVWEKTFESPLDCKSSNQSILKEISPEYSLEGLMLRLKFQYFGHLMQRTDSSNIDWKRPWCWEILKAGGEGDKRLDAWMASPTQWTWVWVGFGSWWWTGKPGMLQSMGSQRIGQDWGTEMNWDIFYPGKISWFEEYEYISSQKQKR